MWGMYCCSYLWLAGDAGIKKKTETTTVLDDVREGSIPALTLSTLLRGDCGIPVYQHRINVMLSLEKSKQ